MHYLCYHLDEEADVREELAVRELKLELKLLSALYRPVHKHRLEGGNRQWCFLLRCWLASTSQPETFHYRSSLLLHNNEI